jgi:hypothetical protein
MTNGSKQQLVMWWALWAAFQSGIFMFYHFLGRPPTELENSSGMSLVWMAGLAPVAISSIIRWLVLPRVQRAQAALPLFVAGIAFAEAACFLGLFIFPTHQKELFILSALGIFQFVPYFARRFYA